MGPQEGTPISKEKEQLIGNMTMVFKRLVGILKVKMGEKLFQVEKERGQTPIADLGKGSNSGLKYSKRDIRREVRKGLNRDIEWIFLGEKSTTRSNLKARKVSKSSH